jgi:hypothetical protein
MAEKIKIPVFATEAEEAQWWYDNREATGRALVQASQEGRSGIGSIGRMKKLRELAGAQQASEVLTSSE